MTSRAQAEGSRAPMIRNPATRAVWSGTYARRGASPPGAEAGHRPDQPTARPQTVENRDWFRIVNQDGGDAADIYIYDEIGWFGTSASAFIEQLQAVTASKINLHLNTPGGNVFDAVAIYNALLNHPATVTVYVDALAASAGSYIAQAGDRRVMARNSQMMIHQASGLEIGTADDMRAFAELLDRQDQNIASIYNDRASGGDKRKLNGWLAAMKAETWYNAQEAVDAGLADEVAPLPDRQQEAKALAAVANWDLSVFRYAGRAQAPTPTPVAVADGPPAAEPAPADKPPVEAQPPADPPPDPAAAPDDQPAADPATPDDPPEPAPADDPDPEPAHADPSEGDDWDELTAHLTDHDPDDIAQLLEALQ